MAVRKELLRDLAEINSKMLNIDEAILKAEKADEDTEALDKEFAANLKLKKSLVRSLARKESLDDDVDEETKDADEDDDEKDDDDDEDEKKSRKGKKSLAIHTNSLRRKLTPVQRIGAYFWGKAATKSVGERHAYDTVMRVWGDEQIAKAAVGAMTTAIPTIVQDASNVVIDILSTKSIVRASGAHIEDMSRGNKTIFRQNAGASAFYFGEGSTSTVSKVGFDHIDMTWHKMGALVYLTREELLFPTINTGQYVVDEITRRLALREDNTFLLSAGSSFEPKGIGAYTNASNLINSTLLSGVVSWQSIANDLASLESVLSGNMVQGPYALYMNQNVVTFLKAVTNGFTFPFRDELSKPQPTLNGHPVFCSQQIPTNTNTTSAVTTALSSTSTTLTVPTAGVQVGWVISGTGISGSPTVASITSGTALVASAAQTVASGVTLTFTASAGASGSPIFLVKPEHLIVADAYQYDIQMSSEGSFNDGGTQVNLFGEQKVAFLATSAIDFATYHDVSTAILTASGWTTSAGVIGGTDRYTQAASSTTSSASSVNG